jgi:hypothetical protein
MDNRIRALEGQVYSIAKAAGELVEGLCKRM